MSSIGFSEYKSLRAAGIPLTSTHPEKSLFDHLGAEVTFQLSPPAWFKIGAGPVQTGREFVGPSAC